MFDFTFLISAVVFVVLDYIYLGVMKNYFLKQVQLVQGSPLKINLLASIICYIFLITGINYFIIKPNRSIQDAFLLGLVIYAVYETTNLALFKNWSWLTVIIDSLWGGTLFALTAFIVHKIKFLFK
uniref:DUF2177 family protein n=1 Tax=viral metagenome TaxID=1070528 RepID=A0A6C0KPR3_9ZZZZ